MSFKNIFNKTFNPKTFDEGLLARYPNNTKLVDTKISDENGNTQILMTEEGFIITNEKFSGVVYINKTTYEVFKGVEHNKIGIFVIGNGTNWDIETPRQLVNKAHTDFRNIFYRKIKENESKCLCSFPRISNYLTRSSSESSYIAVALRNEFLTFINSIYDNQTEIETHNLKCKVCSSEYTWKYKERGIDELNLTKDKLVNKIGKDSEEDAPNFIDSLTDKLYCNQSYLFRHKLYESDLCDLINYLFEKKE